MSGYTKLFSSILASTIWREDKDTRIVWITLLAMADRNGMAEGSIPGLADFARLSVDETRKALIKLESPDPDSRTQVDEGRRIRTVDGGWLLVNHAKYRQKLNEDERREYKRVKQAQYRAEDAAEDTSAVDTSGQVLTGVDNSGQPLTSLTNVTQAEAEASPEEKRNTCAEAGSFDAGVVWEMWRAEVEEALSDLLPLTPRAKDYDQCRQIVEKQRPAEWVRLSMRCFLVSKHRDISAKPRTLGYLLHWWSWVEHELVKAGYRPEKVS